MSSVSKVRSSSEAEVPLSTASENTSASVPSSLPLRLSVARGGLGLELCRPVWAGPFLVEELLLDLPGLKYPLDLSQGVKQFRHRRSQLRALRLRVDLQALSATWESALRVLWGEGVKVRLRPFHEAEPDIPLDANENEVGGVPSLAVTVYRGDEAITFDLVVTSGVSPRLVVDSPRVLGRADIPLLLCFQTIDAGLRLASPGEAKDAMLSLVRSGRAIEMSGIAEAVALCVLPGLGCRLPEVKDQVVRSITFSRGQVELSLGIREQAFFAAGRRGLWASGAADFLVSADQELGQGDSAVARRLYIDALEQAPGHPEALLSLAELDLAAGDRGESTLSFLNELQGSAPPVSRQAEARHCLALAEGLLATGRDRLARETQERYLELETDPILSALAGVELARRADSPERARSLLDQAVARAPSLQIPRRERFTRAIESGDIRTALSDAEHLEASELELSGKAGVCTWVGGAFVERGLHEEAQRWLQHALRLDPDHAISMLRLAESLVAIGQTLRAAELLQAAVRRLLIEIEKASVEPATAAESLGKTEPTREHLSSARYLLAKVLLEEDHNVSIALGHLSSVETRSLVGVDARLMEAAIHQSRGDTLRRDRAISRLIEAVEMGWVDLNTRKQQLRDLIAEIERSPTADQSLIQFATRVLSVS